MSLLKTSLESPPVATPFKVRMEPYLIESVCELARLVRDKGVSNSDISGLLFGSSEAATRAVEALKTFVDVGPHSELARRQRWEKAYQSTFEEAKNDPELSQLEIVGWFSFRTGSGLLNSDVVFHNQHFRKTDDIALIIWREGPSQITAEVYCKSDNDKMTAEDYRWGSVRLSADIRHMREPVELAMRMKLTDDSYLRTYETEASSGFDTLKQRFFGFLHRGKEEAALNENIRGLIGDGRSNGRSKPTINAIEPLPNRQVYFNPYADAPANRNRAVLSEAAKPAAAAAAAAAPAVAPVPAEVTSATAAQAAAAPSQPVTAPPLAAPPLTAPPLTAPPLTAPPLTATTDPVQTPVWPAVGNGYATAPARIPEFAPDFRFNDGRLPPPLPPNAGLDLANIGRAPRTGRMASNEISGVPMLLRPPVARRSFPWPWAVALFLVCSSLVFGFLVLGGLQGSNGRLGQIVQTMFPGNELNLRVRNEDDRLRLTWNQRNHSVESASDATLQIFDGATHREIHLDGRQVADGSVLYRPVTNDVTFRLEVHSEQGPTSGSVRVLDGLSGRQATLDVSAPAAPLNPVQTAVGPAPVNPAAVDSGSVPASTTPYDPNQAAALTAQVPPPTTGTSGLPFSATAVPVPRTAYRKSAAPRYETPDTIEPIPASGGSTINGWDTAEQRPRVAKPRATTPATFPPTVPTTAGFVAPRPLIQVTPNILSIPSGTIPTRTRVAVQVEIDPAGHVTSARVVDSGVNPAVSGAAVAAARKWTFDPASSNGRHVNSEHTIMFEFPVR